MKLKKQNSCDFSEGHRHQEDVRRQGSPSLPPPLIEMKQRDREVHWAVLYFSPRGREECFTLAFKLQGSSNQISPC